MAGGALLILMWLAGAGGVAEPMAVREYSAPCAEHYARIYQVPVGLVEAVIEVESNWQGAHRKSGVVIRLSYACRVESHLLP
jgi:soluble lytic murein transglycosylase-like protein